MNSNNIKDIEDPEYPEYDDDTKALFAIWKECTWPR